MYVRIPKRCVQFLQAYNVLDYFSFKCLAYRTLYIGINEFDNLFGNKGHLRS